MTDERAPDGAPESNTEPVPTPPADAPAPDAASAPATQASTASYTPPPVPPPVIPQPAMAQPAVAWSAPPAVAVAVAGKRTTLAMAAGILLLLGGIGGILLGLLVAVVGGTVIRNLNFDQYGYFPELRGADPGAVAGGVVVFVGAIIAAYSVAYLLAGIGVLRTSNWARVLGIVVGIISGLIWLSGATNAAQVRDPSGAAGLGIFSIVMLALHVYVVVVLLFFWRSRTSTT
jgi:uncharacterized membrane protein (DUF2068 family)